MLLCEILLKISKALKFYPIKTNFALFVFGTWVPVSTEHAHLKCVHLFMEFRVAVVFN